MLRLFLLSWALVACAPIIKKEYITTPLTHDQRPVLPKITAQELACLDKVTYQKLFDRQRLITEYAIDLESIIDSTKQEPKK
jgi:hypothetical protein